MEIPTKHHVKKQRKKIIKLENLISKNYKVHPTELS